MDELLFEYMLISSDETLGNLVLKRYEMAAQLEKEADQLLARALQLRVQAGIAQHVRENKPSLLALVKSDGGELPFVLKRKEVA